MKTIRPLLFTALLLAARAAFAQAPVALPEPVAPPLTPAPPVPEQISDPFSPSGADTGSPRALAALNKLAQELQVVALGRSATGKAEAIFRLPDKRLVHLRIGESFNFVSPAGATLPCELTAVSEQEVTLLISGKTELRLR